MTYQDYIDWANEYREQVGVIEKMIQEKKRQIRSRFKTAQERAIAERALSELYAMKEDNIRAAATLEERARTIKEKEG